MVTMLAIPATITCWIRTTIISLFRCLRPKSRGEWEAACRDQRHSTHPDPKQDIIFENCGAWRRVFGGMGTFQEVKIHVVAEDIPPDLCFLLSSQNVEQPERFADHQVVRSL